MGKSALVLGLSLNLNLTLNLRLLALMKILVDADACPKSVRPTDAVMGLRRKLFVQRLKSLFGRKSHEA